MALMVRRFCVTSSPRDPSPRVAPRTNMPSLVDERDREAVDLGLGDERHRLVRSEPLSDVVAHLASASSVVTFSSEPIGREVVDLDEALRRGCADAQAWASPASGGRDARPRAASARRTGDRTRRPRPRGRRGRGSGSCDARPGAAARRPVSRSRPQRTSRSSSGRSTRTSGRSRGASRRWMRPQPTATGRCRPPSLPGCRRGSRRRRRRRAIGASRSRRELSSGSRIGLVPDRVVAGHDVRRSSAGGGCISKVSATVAPAFDRDQAEVLLLAP